MTGEKTRSARETERGGGENIKSDSERARERRGGRRREEEGWG